MDDLVGVGGEDAALGAGEVVLGEGGDLLEEMGAGFVVEEPRGEGFGRGGEAGAGFVGDGFGGGVEDRGFEDFLSGGDGWHLEFPSVTVRAGRSVDWMQMGDRRLLDDWRVFTGYGNWPRGGWPSKATPPNLSIRRRGLTRFGFLRLLEQMQRWCTP